MFIMILNSLWPKKFYGAGPRCDLWMFPELFAKTKNYLNYEIIFFLNTKRGINLHQNSTSKNLNV